MAVRWHSLPEHFTAKKNISTYITRKKEKKITEEENGLEPELESSCPSLRIATYALIQCAT